MCLPTNSLAAPASPMSTATRRTFSILIASTETGSYPSPQGSSSSAFSSLELASTNAFVANSINF